MTNRKFSRKQIGQALGLLVLGLTLLVAAYSATATKGEHRHAETPGSELLIIFSPIFFENDEVRGEVEIVKGRAKDHGYQEREYLDKEEYDDNPGDATAKNFKAALETPRGILFIATHSAPGELMIEVIGRGKRTECEARIDEYVRDKIFATKEELACEDYTSVGVAIVMRERMIKRYFKDTNTIVHISSCSSWSLADAFAKARDFFGHDGRCSAEGTAEATRILWGRLHGEEENGTKRPATVAGKDLPAGLKHQHRAELDTVLSPAVTRHLPPKDVTFAVPMVADGTVIFDTKMDRTVDPAAVITVTGCEARILNPNWTSPFILDFALALNTPGRATLTVHWEAAKAERDFKNNLDGNTEWREGTRWQDFKVKWGHVRENPEGGEDHIGPNKDNFVWRVWCVEKSGTSFNFTVPVGTGGTCKAKTPALGSIQISEIWATVLNSKTNQPLPQGTPVTFTVNLKPGVEKLQHISDIDSITVSAPGFKSKEVKGPFTAFRISVPGPIPVSIQIINLGTVALEPQ